MLLAQITNTPAWWQFLSYSKDSFASLESCFKMIAILAAGVWAIWHFFIKRERYPRAVLSHRIQFWEYTSKEWLLRVNLLIKNDSTVLMRIYAGHTWIQQMKPWPDQEIESYKEASKVSEKAPYEAKWPFAGDFAAEKLHKERELEPGESDEISMDFFIDKQRQQVLVYSFIENSSKPGRHIGWTASTIVDFTKPSVELLSEGVGQSQEKPRPERAKQ